MPSLVLMYPKPSLNTKIHWFPAKQATAAADAAAAERADLQARMEQAAADAAGALEAARAQARRAAAAAAAERKRLEQVGPCSAHMVSEVSRQIATMMSQVNTGHKNTERRAKEQATA